MALTPLFTDGCDTCSTSYAEEGTLQTSNLYVEILLPIDASTLAVQITGSWAATLLFEGTINGDDWFATDMQPLPSGLLVSSTTSNGVWRTTVAGYSKFRVRTTAITDEASVAMRVTSGPSAVPVVEDEDAVLTWTRTAVTLTGAADQVLLATNVNRRALMIRNRAGNADIYYDVAGQSIDTGAGEGIALVASDMDVYSGQEAPTGTITVTGTAGNIVSVYVGAIS